MLITHEQDLRNYYMLIIQLSNLQKYLTHKGSFAQNRNHPKVKAKIS